jgi:hypothetical protein
MSAKEKPLPKSVILEPGGPANLDRFRANLGYRLGTKNTSMHVRLALYIAARMSPEECVAAHRDYLLTSHDHETV